MADNKPQPTYRPRRLRRGAAWRDALADVSVHPANLIYPIFVRDGQNVENPVSSMPGVSQLSVDRALETITRLHKRGLKHYLLFAVVDAEKKDATGSISWDEQNPVIKLIREVRSAGLDVILHADACFCEYTDHGHCGVLCDDPGLTVDNDATLPLLARQSVALAEAGADVIAPSGMMDGMVQAIRSALDEAGHPHVAVMSYAIKYASSLYGPFREAGEGGMAFGDRRGYQMDYRRSREWQTELQTDIDQGADIVMIKPALAYLDIIAEVKRRTSLPVAAYHVSGEYSMLHAAAERGWLDLQPAVLEHTHAIRRAGADLIITYFAPQLIDWLKA